MLRTLAILAFSAISIPAFAQFQGGLNLGGGGFGGGGGGGGQRGNAGGQGNQQGRGGNFGQAGNRGGQGGQFGGNRIQGKSLFPEGVQVYGYDADNSIIIASGLTRTADGRGLIPSNIEALYGYDADNSIIIKSSGASRQATLKFIGDRMDKQLASLIEAPEAKAGDKSVAAPRLPVVLKFASLPPGALPRLHRLGFESTGSLSKMSIPGTLPQNRLAIAAIQPFVQKIESTH